MASRQCKNSPTWHDQTQWQLSVDSSTKSLKVLLLHSGNEYPSIPLTYSIQMKEDYKNVKQVLLKIKYAEFNWYVWCVILRCWDFCWVYRVAPLNIMCSLLVQQQGWWRALPEDPMAAEGSFNTRKLQCHQGATCKPEKSFITNLSH